MRARFEATGVLMVALAVPSFAADDVGVISSKWGCPSQSSQTIQLHMDNEDRREASSLWGWVGRTSLDSAGNIDYYFCRVPGSLFVNAPGTFAVLKLGDTCPAGAVTLQRRFDNENNRNANFVKPNTGAIAPSQIGNDSLLHFCVFQNGTGSFPWLGDGGGVGYGVFGNFKEGVAGQWGTIFSDDEDSSNSNHYYLNGSLSYNSPFPQILQQDGNTKLWVSWVNPPSPAPVAVCRVDPPWAYGYIHAHFQDSGSFAKGNRQIVSYRWTLGDGSVVDGTDAYWMQHLHEGISAMALSGTLTVTDDAGDRGSTTCTALLYCQEDFSDQHCPL